MTTLTDSLSTQNSSDRSLTSKDSIDQEDLDQLKEISTIKLLNEGSFPVYLVTYLPTGVNYAMKVFPWKKGAPSPYFLNEERFSRFFHPNITQIVHARLKSQDDFCKKQLSFLLMEYAKYGDFFDVLITHKVIFDEILARTYFHQLIDGLEALHSNGAAHLDIKLENVLLTEDFQLKLVDFDLSYMAHDEKVKTKGTKNFRAPEMLQGNCINPKAADIYSAGIFLFLLKTSGFVPFWEDDSTGVIHGLAKIKPRKFWKAQCLALEKHSSFFSEDFKELFLKMVRYKPAERPTIQQIKNSKWYKKRIYSKADLKKVMSRHFQMRSEEEFI